MFVLLIVISLLLLLIYNYLVYPYNHWKNLNVPGPKVEGWHGHIPSIWHNKQNYIYEFAQIYENYRLKYNFVGIFVLRQPQLLIINPKVVKTVLVSKFKFFRDNYFSEPVTKQTDKLLGRNPFILKGDEWKEKRGELVSGFSVFKIKTQYPIIEDSCKKLVNYINDQSKPIEVKDLCARYTCNIVASCIFGMNAEAFSEKNPIILDRARNIMSNQIWSHLAIISLFPFINKFYKGTYVDKTSEDFFIKLMRDATIHRKSSVENRLDYLDFLLDVQQRKGGSLLDIAANGLTFFLDGFDTSSIFMFNVLYELSKNQEVQLRLREEIEHYVLLHNGNLSYDFIEEMSYLDMVINETLRLHPSIPVIAKICTEDTNFELYENQNVIIKKGTIVNIPIYCLHTDEKYYSNPYNFDPERFSPESGGAREFKEKCIFLPFSDGPRICLGMRFALAQGKGLAKKLLQCKHPSSRKTLNLIKKTKKIKNRQLKKFGNAAKMNVQGKQLFWFYEQIEDIEGPLTPDMYKELIQAYLARFDEELEQINIKHTLNKKRSNQHASRESVIKITLEKEVSDFNGGGLELPNLCDPVEFKHFQDWDGDASKIQHLKLHFVSKKWLESLNKEDKMIE
uniref:CSON013017 protein n=1 Tax=Culicoides sonorensis TaxID=179676 RepID=A0A336LRC8_CULSO